MLNTITCRQFNYVIIPSNSRGQCVFGGRNNLIKTGPGFSVRLSQQKSLSNLSWLYQALLPFAFNVWRVTKTSEHESLKLLFNPHWLWNCWCSGCDTVGAVVGARIGLAQLRPCWCSGCDTFGAWIWHYCWRSCCGTVGAVVMKLLVQCL